MFNDFNRLKLYFKVYLIRHIICGLFFKKLFLKVVDEVNIFRKRITPVGVVVVVDVVFGKVDLKKTFFPN